MDYSTVDVTIVGIAPYSQSHKHDEPKLEGEQADAYDIRTWPSKMNTEVFDGVEEMIIPAFAIHQSLTEAARYSKRKIEGQRNATWTAKIRSGIAIMCNGRTGIKAKDVKCEALSLHADGKRGSGARVTRRLPQVPAGWQATYEVTILDPIITETIFAEMLELSGLFIGLGQFRPENGGSNGRFRIEKLVWKDNRQVKQKAA